MAVEPKPAAPATSREVKPPKQGAAGRVHSSLSAERASCHQLTHRCCLLAQTDATVGSLTHRGRLPPPPPLGGTLTPRATPLPDVEKLGQQPGLPCPGPTPPPTRPGHSGRPCVHSPAG